MRADEKRNVFVLDVDGEVLVKLHIELVPEWLEQNPKGIAVVTPAGELLRYRAPGDGQTRLHAAAAERAASRYREARAALQ